MHSHAKRFKAILEASKSKQKRMRVNQCAQREHKGFLKFFLFSALFSYLSSNAAVIL